MSTSERWFWLLHCMAWEISGVEQLSRRRFRCSALARPAGSALAPVPQQSSRAACSSESCRIAIAVLCAPHPALPGRAARAGLLLAAVKLRQKRIALRLLFSASKPPCLPHPLAGGGCQGGGSQGGTRRAA